MTKILNSSIDDLINAVRDADSASKLFLAVAELAKVRSPLAIPTLIEVLGFNNPGAAVAATEGLIAIGESAVTTLLKNVDDYNYGARAWAIRVFAGIGDPRALDLLLQAASKDFSLSVRRAATKGLGSMAWEKFNPQEIQQAEQKILKTLLFICNDEEWVVRYASVFSLASLYKTTHAQLVKDTIKEKLIGISQEDREICVKTRAKFALTNLNQV